MNTQADNSVVRLAVLAFLLMWVALSAQPVWAEGDVSTISGVPGTAGSLDGSNQQALFSGPQGVAVDAAGNTYVADTNNGTIRKVAPGGSVTTIAGTAGAMGGADGTGPAAQFAYPEGVAVDAGGNVFVADTANGTIRKITPAGVVTTLAGTAGAIGSADGTGPVAEFYFPIAVAVDASDNVYVSDSGNCTIRKVTQAGVVTTIAGTAGVSGAQDGTGPTAQFDYPAGMTIGSNGDIYVVDTINCLVRQVTPAGAVTTVAGTAGGSGTNDGTGPTAQFNYPLGIAASGTTLYILDGNNVVRSMSATFAVTTLNIASAQFAYLTGIAADSHGNMYVADANNDTIDEVNSSLTVTILAGLLGIDGSQDGSLTPPEFNTPAGTAVDVNGNLFIADRGNNTVREISASGDVTTLAGTAGTAGFQNGANATFSSPSAVAVDGAGNVYVADTTNNAIRKIAPGGVVSTFAGGVALLPASNPAAASQVNSPQGIAVDGSGNVYVANSGPNISSILKIAANGTVALLAGSTTQGFADGTGGAAQFHTPCGIALDGTGNVYVADSGNDTIRKISSTGQVTTVAGIVGTAGAADGPVAVAQFKLPTSVAVDTAGDIFVSDNQNQTIREISQGAVTTIAGYAASSGTADGWGPAAQFESPGGLSIDSSGNLYLSDFLSDTIRVCATTYPIPEGAPVVAAAPESQGVAAGATVTLTATAFGNNTPTVAWQVSTDNGATYQPIAGATSSTYSFTVTSPQIGDLFEAVFANNFGSVTSSPATLTQGPGMAGITLGNLGASYTGSPQGVTVTTNPSGLSTSVTYNGSATLPTAVGSYPVVATITDPNYTGTASGTFVINKATAIVTLSNLTATYNGLAQAVKATTSPAGLAVVITYGGSSTIPSAAGTYAVSAVVQDANYAGGASNNFVISAVAGAQTFAQWETSIGFTGGATETPRGDGVPNLLKYFYDIDPAGTMTQADRAGLPTLNFDDTSTPGTEYMVLDYRQSLYATGLTVNVQTSTDLKTWTTVAPPAIVKQIGTDSGDPIMEVGVIYNGGPRQFIRLSITQP
jgi:sugar lactone lactonase YvrE